MKSIKGAIITGVSIAAIVSLAIHMSHWYYGVMYG